MGTTTASEIDSSVRGGTHVSAQAQQTTDEPLIPEQLAHGDKQRNAPCPCGSNQKYKKCCGSAAAEAKRRQQQLLKTQDRLIERALQQQQQRQHQ